SVLTLIAPSPPCAPPFPYTTLFRSEPRELDRLGGRFRGGLLGVDRLPRRDRLAQRGNARLRHEEVAVDLPRRIGERLIEIGRVRSEEHTSELQSRFDLVCRLLLEQK